jgi:hypothetical protein
VAALSAVAVDLLLFFDLFFSWLLRAGAGWFWPVPTGSGWFWPVPTGFSRSALALLVARIGADHHHRTPAPDHFALLADLFD